MARLPFIELGQGKDLARLPILHEDRCVIAIDKPAGWLLVPFSWQRTQRNLQAAITSSIAAGAFWARSRNLKFLRAIHRLDGDTSGVLLLARSLGAVETLSGLFETRQMSKFYLAVVQHPPARPQWTCDTPLSPDPGQPGRMRVDRKGGKEAQTSFQVLQTQGKHTLIAAQPLTGRTHQIRLHLLESGCPIAGDDLYGPEAHLLRHRSRLADPDFPLGLRALALAYTDPFQHRPVRIVAPAEAFTRSFGFDPALATAALNDFLPRPKPAPRPAGPAQKAS